MRKRHCAYDEGVLMLGLAGNAIIVSNDGFEYINVAIGANGRVNIYALHISLYILQCGNGDNGGYY